MVQKNIDDKEYSGVETEKLKTLVSRTISECLGSMVTENQVDLGTSALTKGYYVVTREEVSSTLGTAPDGGKF